MGTMGGKKPEDVSYASFMSSKAFEFLVGPEKKPFIIHSELVASLSAVLQRLVKGELKEAQKGSVVWEHVDEQTFIRFSQYAYVRTYDYPAFRPRPQPKAGLFKASLLAVLDTVVQEQVESSWRTVSRIWLLTEAGDVMFRLMPKHKFTSPNTQRDPLAKRAMKRAPPLADGQNNDAELLLSHARLYVFADCYEITPLMGLSLSTLYNVLMEFPEWSDIADMLIQLLRYCYENDTPAVLKDLVMRYAVCHVENLWKRKEVTELARTNGEFSSAIIEAMLAGLIWHDV
ncbi:hypothetical protein E4U38_005669 [Claviceps purpurea]|nr:hypothetical protein E4U38_005669 [Claviceps purpurea]